MNQRKLLAGAGCLLIAIAATSSASATSRFEHSNAITVCQRTNGISSFAFTLFGNGDTTTDMYLDCGSDYATLDASGDYGRTLPPPRLGRWIEAPPKT
jgi:hypothetical protein